MRAIAATIEDIRVTRAVRLPAMSQSLAPPETQVAAPFSARRGGMARRIRDFDWSATPLGPAPDWPAELRTAVNLMLDSRFPAAVVWGPELTTLYNDAFRLVLGAGPEALGRPFAEVWAEVWDDVAPSLRRALAGRATYIEDFPLRIERSGHAETAWFTFCYSPLRLEDGTVAGLLDTAVETTEAVRARQELKALNNELRHRLKNTLTTVQSIAWQTLRGGARDPQALEALMDRIVALGAAHDVLFSSGWTGATLPEAVAATLRPLPLRDRIRAGGPDVPIGARGAVSLALLLHELATNAIKYGALSSDDGRVELQWSVDGETLELRWRENGGAPASLPAQLGFGTRLIDMGLSARGQVVRRYLPSGFEADIQAPLADLAGG